MPLQTLEAPSEPPWERDVQNIESERVLSVIIWHYGPVWPYVALFGTFSTFSSFSSSRRSKSPKVLAHWE